MHFALGCSIRSDDLFANSNIIESPFKRSLEMRTTGIVSTLLATVAMAALTVQSASVPFNKQRGLAALAVKMERSTPRPDTVDGAQCSNGSTSD